MKPRSRRPRNIWLGQLREDSNRLPVGEWEYAVLEGHYGTRRLCGADGHDVSHSQTTFQMNFIILQHICFWPRKYDLFSALDTFNNDSTYTVMNNIHCNNHVLLLLAFIALHFIWLYFCLSLRMFIFISVCNCLIKKIVLSLFTFGVSVILTLSSNILNDLLRSAVYQLIGGGRGQPWRRQQ